MSRPRAYDAAELVAHAMHAFWSQGYRGMSIDALVSKTGVSRASLYTAYPDKRSIFVESVKRYLEDIVHDNVERLNGVEPAGEAVRQFFLKLAEAPLARLRRGCLLTNTAVELGVSDREVARLIRQAYTRVENALHERLVDARKAGVLSADVEPRRYARQLMAVLQGLRVMARVGVERDVLRDAVNGALAPLEARRSRRVTTTRAITTPRARRTGTPGR